MCGVDEAAQVIGSAVTPRRGKERDAVVAPVTRPRKIGHRHQLDDRDTKRRQGREPGRRSREGAFGAERADMQFVEDGVREIDARPLAVSPLERLRVDDLRRPVHALGLPPRRRIGQQAVVVEAITVPVAGGDLRQHDREGAVRGWRQGMRRLAGWALDDHLDGLAGGRPHAERGALARRPRAE